MNEFYSDMLLYFIKENKDYISKESQLYIIDNYKNNHVNEYLSNLINVNIDMKNRIDEDKFNFIN